MTGRSDPRSCIRRLLGPVAWLLLSLMQAVSAGDVEKMSVEAAHAAARDGALFLVDIRTPREWRESGIPDVAIPLDMTASTFLRDLEKLHRTDPARRIALICAVGGRSRYLSHVLARKGFQDIVDVPAGIHGRDGWRARGLPLRSPDAPLATPAGHPAPASR